MAEAQGEATPSTFTMLPWIYERRAENVEQNVYPAEESGKWMMFYHVSDIDDAWSRAKSLYTTGQLPNIRSMKVSTDMPTENKRSNSNVLIFYCGPASDKNKMLAIGRDLAEKMQYSKPSISYKTDMQTLQGVHGSTYSIRL